MVEKSIKVKRPVTIKTIVTDSFKKQMMDELSKELHLLDTQIMQLELQSKQIHDQASAFGTMYADEGTQHLQQAMEDITSRLQQMSMMKQELHTQKESIHHLVLNNMIVTGNLENYVELSIGENIYEKFKTAEIIIKDGIIQDIIN